MPVFMHLGNPEVCMCTCVFAYVSGFDLLDCCDLYNYRALRRVSTLWPLNCKATSRHIRKWPRLILKHMEESKHYDWLWEKWAVRKHVREIRLKHVTYSQTSCLWCSCSCSWLTTRYKHYKCTLCVQLKYAGETLQKSTERNIVCGKQEENIFK